MLRQPRERSGRPPRRPRSGGYTLTEVLVATGLLVLLGSGLLTLLTQGVNIWRRSEERGRVYEKARAVLDVVAEDLRSTLVRSHARGDDDWVRFLADEGPGGGQRLRFVRTTSAETSDTILREGGRLLATRTPAMADGIADAAEADAGLLAAPGGAMEVLYAPDPRPDRHILWRGFRSPVGGPDSLFIDGNLEGSPDAAAPPVGGPGGRAVPAKAGGPAGKEKGATGKPGAAALVPLAGSGSPGGPAGSAGSAGSEGEGKTAVGDASAPEVLVIPVDDSPLARVASPLARDILHLGFRFWGPTTTTWREVPALDGPRAGEESGPSLYWDSTRAILELPAEGREFRWRRVAGSLDDATDDIFPARVEITIVVGSGNVDAAPRLAEPLPEGGSVNRIVVSGSLDLPDDPADRYVLIDAEWIAVGEASGGTLQVADGGRGRRWTMAAPHEIGAPVLTGSTFRRVVDIPGYREPPGAGGGATRSTPRARTRVGGLR